MSAIVRNATRGLRNRSASPNGIPAPRHASNASQPAEPDNNSYGNNRINNKPRIESQPSEVGGEPDISQTIRNAERFLAVEANRENDAYALVRDLLSLQNRLTKEPQIAALQKGIASLA